MNYSRVTMYLSGGILASTWLNLFYQVSRNSEISPGESFRKFLDKEMDETPVCL